MTSRRRLALNLIAVPLLALSLALSGCAALNSERTFTLDEAELQRLVDKSFPVDQKLLDLFQISLKAPRIRLLPESNRIATELEVSSSDRFLASLLKGKLAFDAMLRYEPSDQSLRLSQVRVQQFNLAALNAASGERALGLPLDRIGSALAEKVLEGFPVYTLPPERAARLKSLGVAPQNVAVTRNGVEITLAPPAR